MLIESKGVLIESTRMAILIVMGEVFVSCRTQSKKNCSLQNHIFCKVTKDQSKCKGADEEEALDRHATMRDYSSSKGHGG